MCYKMNVCYYFQELFPVIKLSNNRNTCAIRSNTHRHSKYISWISYLGVLFLKMRRQIEKISPPESRVKSKISCILTKYRLYEQCVKDESLLVVQRFAVYYLYCSNMNIHFGVCPFVNAYDIGMSYIKDLWPIEILPLLQKWEYWWEIVGRITTSTFLKMLMEI